jgi:hypothetical protein
MQASKVEVGQKFKLAVDERILKRLAYDGPEVYGVDADNNLVGVHPDSSCELAGAETPGDHITGALRFTINHHDPDNGRALSGRIEVNSLGIDIFFDGYGQHTMNPGFGSPVFMEVDDDGHPVVHCWAEIDSEDPTHKIRLHAARDTREATV